MGRARPGVRYHPLTKIELETLQMLSEGYSPKELIRNGQKPYQIWTRMHRMRLKLDAFTTEHMVAIALKRGLIR